MVIVDHFGLPGGKYVTEVGCDSMDFIFNSHKDAMLCVIMISDRL